MAKAKKQAPVKKAPRKPKAREVKEKPRDAGLQAFFDQGREARNASIPRNSCPLFQRQQVALWQEGWDFQHEALS